GRRRLIGKAELGSGSLQRQGSGELLARLRPRRRDGGARRGAGGDHGLRTCRRRRRSGRLRL
ncbi:hypothetical protein LTR94_028098, partial [Friedmanniomyces endolithicus]